MRLPLLPLLLCLPPAPGQAEPDFEAIKTAAGRRPLPWPVRAAMPQMPRATATAHRLKTCRAVAGTWFD